MTRRVIVVGAGIGGLVTAALLAARGVAVTLLERQPTLGGKLRRLHVGAADIDVGPTVLTLREVFEAVFDACGATLDDAMTLTKAEVLARHVWPDGAALDLHADLDVSADAVGRFAGAGAAREYRAFQARAQDAYETLDAAFIRDPDPSLPRLLLKAGPGRLSRLDPYSTYAASLEQAFTDTRLRQLYGRYATYVGTSPYAAPATLMLIAHVEQRGVWRIAEGMARLPEALAELAVRHGADIRCEAPVAEIEVARGRVAGVRLADGERLAADAVIFDGDSGVLGEGRLGAGVRGAAAPVEPGARSLSALTLAVRAKVGGRPLSHHTVLFSPDYAAEFESLAAGRLPDDASLYVCAQDRGDEGVEVDGGAERLFMILNAPARGDAGWPDAASVAAACAGLERTLTRAGVELDWPGADVAMIGPREFEALAPGSGGALYGASAAGAFAAFRRPGTRAQPPGLYLAGGTVHPGPGLPMAARSGQAAAACCLADLGRRRG